MTIDPIKRALTLRNTLKKNDKVLVVDFSDTLQGKDTSKVIDTMANRNDRYVFRAKVNVKDIDPIATKSYGLPYNDISKMSDSEIESLIKKEEFDFPLWFKHNKSFKMSRAHDYNLPFILQVAGCNFHDGTKTGGCWYCFVDDASNDGVVTNQKTYLGITDTIDSMLIARDKVKQIYAEHGTDIDLKVLRTSGGEPTIVLDWILNLWREIGERSLDYVGQIDSNLSTGTLVDQFEKEGIYEPNILEKLAEYPIKVLTAIKGVNGKNLESNVQSSTTMPEQLHSIKKFLKAGFDIYPQMYNPDPNQLEDYLRTMDQHIDNFSMRVHLGPLKLYGPNKQRLELAADKEGIDREVFINNMVSEWNDNYTRGIEIIDNYLRQAHSVGYKDTVRSDIPLKILK